MSSSRFEDLINDLGTSSKALQIVTNEAIALIDKRATIYPWETLSLFHVSRVFTASSDLSKIS